MWPHVGHMGWNRSVCLYPNTEPQKWHISLTKAKTIGPSMKCKTSGQLSIVVCLQVTRILSLSFLNPIELFEKINLVVNQPDGLHGKWVFPLSVKNGFREQAEGDMGHMGGLINWRRQYRAGFSNTGGSPKPRKRATCQKRTKCIQCFCSMWLTLNPCNSRSRIYTHKQVILFSIWKVCS